MVQVTKAQKAQGGFHHDAAVHPQQEPGDQHIIEIGEDVVHCDMHPVIALDDAILNEGLLIQMHHLGADISGDAHPAEGADQPN